MIRANLLPHERKRLSAFGLHVDLDHLRQALSLLIILATVVTLATAIQFIRMQRLGREATRAEFLLAANEGPRRDLAALAAQVALLQHIERASRLTRHSGNDAASAFAAIGNAVPTSVWLDGIVHQPDGYLISGSAHSLGAVRDTLDAISRTQRPAHASLINVAQDAPRHAVRFTIRLNADWSGAR